METTTALRLPKLLAAYATSYPDVDIELETGPTEALIASVLDRRTEAAFVSGPVSHEDLTAIPVLEEELVLVAGERVRSFDQVITTLASKREARVLVFKTGCSYRLRLEGFLAAHGLVHVRRMEFGTLDGIIGCVEAGMGVSMLPRIVAEPMQQAGRISIHSLPEGAGEAQTLLVYRKDSLLTAAFERFLDHTYEVFHLLPADDAATGVLANTAERADRAPKTKAANDIRPVAS
jgi:DNA-binding transcriptional LysR family regulator